jgi:hypothetical protein
VGAAIGAWWYVFLALYPAQFQADAARRGVDWRSEGF